MRTDLLPIIACPLCQGPLTLQPDAAPETPDADADADASTDAATAPGSAAEIRSGALTCPPCGARYPITDGIPNLLPPELRNTPPA